MALVELVEADRGAKESDACTDRPRLAARAKALIVPIPGTTKLHRLEENLGAADVELTADDLREIDEGTAGIEIEGARLPEAVLAMTETTTSLNRTLQYPIENRHMPTAAALGRSAPFDLPMLRAHGLPRREGLKRRATLDPQ